MRRGVVICMVIVALFICQGCAGRRVITTFSGKIAAADVKTYEKGRLAAADIKKIWAYDSQLIRKVVGRSYEDEFPTKFKEAMNRLDELCKKEGSFTQAEEGTVVADFAVVNWKWAEYIKDKYGSDFAEYLQVITGFTLPF